MTIKKLKSIDIINVLSNLVSEKMEATVKLPADATDTSTLDNATAWKDLVIPAMDALRATADSLETKVSVQQYPIPNYIDLLFGI